MKIKKLKTKIVPKGELDGYWGMNREAAKEIKGYKGKRPKEGFALISKGVKKNKRPRINRHESIEESFIRSGKEYKAAHKIANRWEKKPLKIARQRLNK